MAKELIYTSASKGLKPSSGGFCTVALTAGMAKPAILKLEMLSGYKFLFNLSDTDPLANPVNYAHSIIRFANSSPSVLSRIAYCGSDYTGRINKIAHHFMLAEAEKQRLGPAYMAGQMTRENIFQSQWDRQPHELPLIDLNDFIIKGSEDIAMGHWTRACGDAGWAGELVKAFYQDKQTPAYIIYELGTDVLALFREALSLMPAEDRWEVGFATYYTLSPGDCFYHWRGIVKGSGIEQEIYRFDDALVINLTGPLPALTDNKYVSAARGLRPLAEHPVLTKTITEKVKSAEPKDEKKLELRKYEIPGNIHKIRPGNTHIIIPEHRDHGSKVLKALSYAVCLLAFVVFVFWTTVDKYSDNNRSIKPAETAKPETKRQNTTEDQPIIENTTAEEKASEPANPENTASIEKLPEFQYIFVNRDKLYDKDIFPYKAEMIYTLIPTWLCDPNIDIGRANAFVAGPEKYFKYLNPKNIKLKNNSFGYCSEDEKLTIKSISTFSGDNPIISYEITDIDNHKRSLKFIAIQDKKYNRLTDYLTIELIDEQNQTLFQCRNIKPIVKKIIWPKSGTTVQSLGQDQYPSELFSYLTIDNCDKNLPQKRTIELNHNLKTYRWEIELASQNVTISLINSITHFNDIKMRWQAREDSASNIQKTIDLLLTDTSYEKLDEDNKARHDELSAKLKNHKDKQNELQAEYLAIEKALTDIQKQNPVIIRDLWGLAVYELELNLQDFSNFVNQSK
ncbi:MAG: hypothetical protein JEZ07_02765 [Phycisphaerae bacterium]|nr:hypothetical protein [Phycisphaerae bacterium]